MAEQKKRGPKATAKWQKVMGGLAVLVVGGSVYSMMTAGEVSGPKSNLSQAVSGSVNAVVGDNGGSERYNETVAADNDKNAAIAVERGVTYIPAPEPISPQNEVFTPKPIIEEVKTTTLIPPTVLAPVKTQQQIDNRRGQQTTGVAAAPNPAYAQAMSAYMGQWGGVHPVAVTTVYQPVVIADANPPETAPQSFLGGPDVLVAPFDIGQILYGASVLRANSDAPGPVVATVIGGEQSGGRFVGGFTKQGDGLVLLYTTFTDVEGRTYPVTAYAVDPETASPSMASDVNNHYISRWGGLIASSFAAGFGSAVSAAGTTSIVSSSGDTIESSAPDYSMSDQAWIATGVIGEKLGEKAEKHFDTPSTVTLKPGVALGILIVGK